MDKEELETKANEGMDQARDKGEDMARDQSQNVREQAEEQGQEGVGKLKGAMNSIKEKVTS